MSSPSPHHRLSSLFWGLGVPRGSPEFQKFSSMLSPALSIFGPRVTRTILILFPHFPTFEGRNGLSGVDTSSLLLQSVVSYSSPKKRVSSQYLPLIRSLCQPGSRTEKPTGLGGWVWSSRAMFPSVLAGELTSTHAPQSRSLPDGCVTAPSRIWSLSH